MNGTLPMYKEKPLPSQPGKPVWTFFVEKKFTPDNKIESWVDRLGVVSKCGKYVEIHNGNLILIKEGRHYADRKDALAAACEELQLMRNGLMDTVLELMDKGKES